VQKAANTRAMNDMSPAPRIADVLARIEATRAEAHARLFDFLRIPSVSAQPAHAADCRAAAN
jgi:hypothetical protein